MSNLGRASIRLRTTSSTRRRRRSWRRSSSLGGRRGKVSFRSKNKSENIFPIKNHSDWVANGSEEDEKNTQEAKEAGSGGEEGKYTTFAIFHYLLLLPVPFISATPFKEGVCQCRRHISMIVLKVRSHQKLDQPDQRRKSREDVKKILWLKSSV